MTTQVVDEKHPPSETIVVIDDRGTIDSDVKELYTRRTTDTTTSLETSVMICSSSSSSSLVASKATDAPTEKVLAHQQESMQLQSLARQLEYYFSEQNLAKDTYLQTLRDLNDGCVPVTILANFAKVKAILTPSSNRALWMQEEEMRMHAILQAVNEYYTDVLQVHSIDTATGKIATDDTPSSAITILAVGPDDRNKSSSSISAVLPSVSSVSSLQQHYAENKDNSNNTIILRDVNPTVTEAEVRGLLGEIEKCPPVVSIVSDVANCWFIVLDTSDRSEMMRIMMQLRTKCYPSSGDYVMARLRASIVTTAPVDVYSQFPIADMPANAAAYQFPLKKKKKRRSKSKKSKSEAAAVASPANNAANNGKSMPPGPPSLTDDHFPSLQDEKVEWETTPEEADDSVEEDEASEESTKIGDEEEEEHKSAKALSDAASTATTTSSNASSSQTSSGCDSTSSKQAMGGYAAALLKSPGAVPDVPAVRETQEIRTSTTDDDEKVAPDPVVITSPPTWGGGRSFAEILRKKDGQLAKQKKVDGQLKR